MLYASAPTFGQGVIDPVAAIGALGRKYDVGACVRTRACMRLGWVDVYVDVRMNVRTGRRGGHIARFYIYIR